MVILRISRARRRVVKPRSGQCRRSAASRASGASSWSRSAPLASARATSRSMTPSRRSMSGWSAMVLLPAGTPRWQFLDALAQGLERAQLQLLDRALGSIERGRHLADAPFLDEPHVNHLPLRVGQAIDELKQSKAPLDLLMLLLVGHVRRCGVRITPDALPVIRQRVGRDAEQPGSERHAAPLELRQMRQRLLEHRRGEVFRLAAAAHPAADVGIDAIDMAV